jgi:hypothetical protein
MGFLDGYERLPNLEFIENTDGPGTGVIMTMQNARCNGRERRVNVTFICDESVPTPTNMDVIENPVCYFTMKIKAAGACPIRLSLSSGAGGSGATVFIIILLVVYLVGGVFIQSI